MEFRNRFVIDQYFGVDFCGPSTSISMIFFADSEEVETSLRGMPESIVDILAVEKSMKKKVT